MIVSYGKQNKGIKNITKPLKTFLNLKIKILG